MSPVAYGNVEVSGPGSEVLSAPAIVGSVLSPCTEDIHGLSSIHDTEPSIPSRHEYLISHHILLAAVWFERRRRASMYRTAAAIHKRAFVCIRRTEYKEV